MPSNHEELERCLCLFSFFRRFVPDFSRTARPLTNLKNKEFYWTNECSEVFQIPKNKLVNAPVLAVYNPLLQTELHTDASFKGYGSVLMQKQKDNKFHPVAYFSRCTSAAESRYHKILSSKR